MRTSFPSRAPKSQLAVEPPLTERYWTPPEKDTPCPSTMEKPQRDVRRAEIWQPSPVFFPGESPWTEESGGLQFMGSQRVGHNWATDLIWGNISCKDRLDKEQKWYGPNRNKRYYEEVARIHRRTIQKRFSWPRVRSGVITHLEPDLLEREVKWALGSIPTNKASGCDGIPVELFPVLKDDAVKVLHSIC